MSRTEAYVMLLVIGTALVVAGRFAVPGHPPSLAGSYEALAHLWCGFLIGAGCFGPAPRRFAWALLAAASAIETVMFLMK